MDLKEQDPVVLEAYDWLVKHGPDRANKPADVEYPVWVSFTNEGTMMNSENTVILELSLDPAIITSGRRSSGSGACKIGAAGAPGNWTGMLWQEWYFFRRFPGGRRC